ncbi:hypothetical protein MW290_00555 [Aquincola tertiaricarbonis]|uniref:Hydantoin racemase n=1 Tax=Aquincola tertiaricarbonis TaxID=391953 RepID=A0ABY4S393_AQUTE|nr:hypothetical protein [Aquincola tertiaricarbonis]URI07150.1 hypothetical protein MW290_00555 [Aquincola tertiaricarbonis]
MTRLLILNPNISDSMSALIRAEAERSAAPGTQVVVVAFGDPGLAECAPPPAKRHLGLPPAIARLLEQAR